MKERDDAVLQATARTRLGFPRSVIKRTLAESPTPAYVGAPR
jgi:hypothetical protein